MAKLRMIESKRVLGLRMESASNQYTNNESLSSSDYCLSAYDIQYSPEVEEYARKLSRGDYSQDKSIMGRRRGSVSFTVDLHQHATAGQAPMVGMAFKACGLQQESSGTGVWWTTDAEYGRQPCTIEVQERSEGPSGVGIKFRWYGCMGNPTMTCEQIGQPTKCRFEMQGTFSGVTDLANGDLITPTSFDTADPPANMAMTFLALGTQQFFGRYSINLQNQIELFDDPTHGGGVSGARVVGRNPVLELDPDLMQRSGDDWWDDLTSNTTSQVSITLGSSIYISAPAAQPVDAYKPGSRQGHVTHNLRLGLKRSSGNDELEIRIGSK